MFSFKLIRRPPPVNVQIQALEAEITKAVTPVARQHVAERRRITDHFHDRPDWGWRVNIQQTGLQVLIYLKNANQRIGDKITMATLLVWLFDTGTRAHPIRAKQGKALSFPWGGPGSYNRITPRTGTRPGTGTVSNAVQTVRREVAHPGFSASPVLKNINFKLGGALTRAYRLGIENGLRKISRM